MHLLRPALLLVVVCGAVPYSACAAAGSAPQFVTYVDALSSWWPPTAVAASLGVPAYTKYPMNYTTINLSFLTSSGPVDAALVWSDLLKYMSADNPWGNSTAAIQKALLENYHAAGVKVLVSAFGSTDYPTTAGADPVATATAVAKFVTDNQLDGVDLDWEDSQAMKAGTGVKWLVSCTQTLRKLLPRPYIITHAPQAPYFAPSLYPDDGYLGVAKQTDCDWFNIQYYNQGTSDYTTFQTLFVESDGWATHTAVSQLHAAGIPLSQIVVGKPCTSADATNTGYVAPATLEAVLAQGVKAGLTPAGVMNWQFKSDVSSLSGSWVPTLAPAFAA